MFEDSLVESSGKLAARHPWTTAASFVAQSAALGVLLLFSLIYTESLPTQRWVYVLEAPPPPPAAPAPATNEIASASTQGSAIENAIVVPREIPKTIAIFRDVASPASNANAIIGAIPGGTSTDASRTVMDILGRPNASPPKLAVQKVRVSSGVAQGMLVHQVKPQYPPLAIPPRIQGTVVLQAVIGKDGTVENLRLISGHPMLVQAAMDAVKQWRYKPYYLNAEPVEVDTVINVNFTLAP